MLEACVFLFTLFSLFCKASKKTNTVGKGVDLLSLLIRAVFTANYFRGIVLWNECCKLLTGFWRPDERSSCYMWTP